MTTNVEQDYTTMEKGDKISQAECEAILDCPADKSRYGLLQMGLVATITAQLIQVGKRFHVCTRNYGIYILTDEETPDHSLGMYEKARRTINRGHFIAQEANRANMSDSAKRKHERALIVGSAYSQALARERKLHK